MDFQALLANTYVAGALSGFVAAVAVDVIAFRQFKSIEEAAKYDWGVAAWRWFQGIVSGLFTALGIGLTQ